MNNPEAKKNLIPAKKGDVRNPNGYPAGQKQARTIVREFMNKPCDKLPEGSRVTRFQFLLWAVYESVFIFSKQVISWKGYVEESKNIYVAAEKKLNEFLEIADEKNVEDAKKIRKLKREIEKAKKELRSDERDLDRVTKLFQEASGKAAEHFQKASGQYTEIKELISNTPTIVTADKEDIKNALEVIENEF